MQPGLVEGLSESDLVFLLHLCKLNSPYFSLTTASDSTLTAIVAARAARHLRDNPNSLPRGKSREDSRLHVRVMDVDVAVATDNTGLTGGALRIAVKEDHARGLHPFVFGEYFSACIFLTLANCSHRTVATVGADIVRWH